MIFFIYDDDDGSLPEGRFIGLYATWGWDEWGGFLLPSSQTIMGEWLVQGRCAVSWGRFEPVTLQLQGTEHSATPPHPSWLNILKIDPINGDMAYEANAAATGGW